MRACATSECRDPKLAEIKEARELAQQYLNWVTSSDPSELSYLYQLQSPEHISQSVYVSLLWQKSIADATEICGGDQSCIQREAAKQFATQISREQDKQILAQVLSVVTLALPALRNSSSTGQSWRGGGVGGATDAPVVVGADGAATTTLPQITVTAPRPNTAGPLSPTDVAAGALRGSGGATGRGNQTTTLSSWAICFVAGTPVLTTGGYRAIESLAVGDTVVSRDEVSGRTLVKPVTRLYHNKDRAVLDVVLDDGHRTEVLGATAEHPFFVADRGWVAAGSLVPGDRIVGRASGEGRGGVLLVKAVNARPGRADTYNFEVSKTHTYFVGRLQAWVHNQCKNSGNTTIMSPAEAEAYAASRAGQLQAQLPVGAQGRVTMGVGILQDANNNQVVVVSTSEPRGYLRPGVTLKPGETMISGTGHAEADIVDYAQKNGYNILTIGAGRPICPSCSNYISGANAIPATSLKAR